jgi:large subunit ribosomal protein L22
VTRPRLGAPAPGGTTTAYDGATTRFAKASAIWLERLRRSGAAVATGKIMAEQTHDHHDHPIKASARFARIAPRKARVIANLVRGRDVAEAIQLLQFTNRSAARIWQQLLESAVANARNLAKSHPDHFGGVDVDQLFVRRATVDKGPNKFFRRWRPRAMGRATRITKGISHLAVELALRK